jgi:hypothetical protein
MDDINRPPETVEGHRAQVDELFKDLRGSERELEHLPDMTPCSRRQSNGSLLIFSAGMEGIIH